MSDRRVSLPEIFGLTPVVPALRQSWAALTGDRYTPPVRWGVSSLRILKPWISLPLWAGRVRSDRRVTIYNLPNRNREPRHLGYSVRVTGARDFRGLQLTYDGHDGTDFAIPPGTPVVAAAPGRVHSVRKEMQRGGLKVCVDHGAGLLTASNHLSRVLVRAGQPVARGEVLGLSGMSGLDGVLFAPWLAPHLHFTVFHAGDAACPFAAPGESPLWRHGNHPEPSDGPAEEGWAPTRWSPEGVEDTIAGCRDPELRTALEAVDDPNARAVEVAFVREFHSTRFTAFPPLCTPALPRTPRMTLPFRREDFVGVHWPDAAP